MRLGLVAAPVPRRARSRGRRATSVRRGPLHEECPVGELVEHHGEPRQMNPLYQRDSDGSPTVLAAMNGCHRESPRCRAAACSSVNLLQRWCNRSRTWTLHSRFVQCCTMDCTLDRFATCWRSWSSMCSASSQTSLRRFGELRNEVLRRGTSPRRLHARNRPCTPRARECWAGSRSLSALRSSGGRSSASLKALRGTRCTGAGFAIGETCKSVSA